MNYLITGGAGFIGSHLVDQLVERGDVVVYDNLSSGRMEFISHHLKKDNFRLIEADLLDRDAILAAMDGIDVVFHLAANPDIRHGTANTDYDLEQGTIATYNLLDAMRQAGVGNIVFSSSQTVYGEPREMPVPEDYGPMIPISLYGASKMACEGLITAYAHSFGMNAWIYRFANIIGKRGTHGVIIDFINKLKADSGELEILGDGTQSKPYLLVEECVDAILFGFDNSDDKVNIFNLGSEDWVSVTRLAEILVEELGLGDVKFNYTGGERGWAGDVPRIMLGVDKIKDLGWTASMSAEDAVRSAIKSSIDELW